MRILCPLVLLLCAACSKYEGGADRTPPPRSDTVPPANRIRIIPAQISSSGGQVELLWTIVGDRNWKSASGEGTSFTLADSYPFNADRRGGTHVWELWLKAKSTGAASAGAVIEYEIRLRGSNAGGVSTGVRRIQTSAPTLAEAVKLVESRPGLYPLDKPVKLAEIGRQVISLEAHR